MDGPSCGTPGRTHARTFADAVSALDDAVTRALVVGHNDGLETLASWYSGQQVALKTATFALLRASDPWASWREGSAELLVVASGRGGR